MEKFIKSLSIEQLEMIKGIIDNELSDKKSLSKEHIIKGYENWTEKELKSIKRKYNKALNNVTSNKEYYEIQFQIDCIDLKLCEHL
jgi:hypothetical protein